MTTASVELSRADDGKHVLKVQTPNGCWVNLFLEEIHVPGITAVIQWADYNLNRPAADEYKRLVKHAVGLASRATRDSSDAPPGWVTDPDLSEAEGLLLDGFTRLKAERDHWQANHNEMVARNAVLRSRPEVQGDVLNKLRRAHEVLGCGHPKQCIGRVNEHDRTEPLHCLWCGDITDMAMLVRHLTHIYSAITDGRISKPNTLPDEVERVAGDLETERTQAAVADALAEAGSDDSFRNKLYEDNREIVPYTGEFEPGASVAIYWKPIDGEVGGPFVDHGYVFVYPNEDAEVGACVHIPNPDARGDRDVSPEWLTVAELLANILIERIEFTPPDQELKDQVHGAADWLWQGLASSPQDAASRLYALAGVTGDGARRLRPVDERYAREVKLIEHLDKLGVLRIQRGGRLLSEVMIADKELSKGNAA